MSRFIKIEERFEENAGFGDSRKVIIYKPRYINIYDISVVLDFTTITEDDVEVPVIKIILETTDYAYQGSTHLDFTAYKETAIDFIDRLENMIKADRQMTISASSIE